MVSGYGGIVVWGGIMVWRVAGYEMVLWYGGFRGMRWYGFGVWRGIVVVASENLGYFHSSMFSDVIVACLVTS